jgi:lipopolysaccharide transport system ATP-binding protein
MSDVMIKVEGLGKKYIISHQGAGTYTAMRDVIADKAKKILKKNIQQPSREEFWALKDISFEIKKGEAVGIIGRNGAGKSTLLKVLSRITEPTHGRIEISGRVASLLEVGTGFHPELTGRENIFLNGAILGMTRAEIRQKFDEIVDFSGVEKFLDTPVKRYSSGMYVRLAFAVAAHLEPEILVVDEVLAVGDAEFQKKCLGKMNDVSKKEGRTVLFVSHNMGAISALCSKAILLNSGTVEGFDTTGNVIASYFSNSANTAHSFDLEGTKEKHYDEVAELLSGTVRDSNNEPRGRFYVDEEVFVCMKYRIKQEVNAPIVPNFHFYNGQGDCVFTCNAQNVKPLEAGLYETTCAIPANFLNDGVHFVLIAATTYFPNNFVVNFQYKDALSFEIVDKLHDNPLRYNYAGPMPGYIRPNLKFSIQKL